MLLDGERVVALFAKAKKEVVICAPFIKLEALKAILSKVQKSVKITVYTRWRADEVALGVTDLEVFDFLKDIDNSRLFLIDNLHAKLYVADDDALVGSANVTNAALGWSIQPNVELLVEVSRSNEWISMLFDQLKNAYVANNVIKENVLEESRKFDIVAVRNVVENREIVKGEGEMWLPISSVPEIFFEVYSKGECNKIAKSTLDDIFSDMKDIGVPLGLSEADFVSYVKGYLSKTPAFRYIIERIPGKIDDRYGVEILSHIRPSFDYEEKKLLWRNILNWIRVFFSDEYEVAPTAFEVRLRS